MEYHRSMSRFLREVRETLVLGIPMAGAQLSAIAINGTDVAMVGRLEGDALAAMAVGQASFGLCLSFGIGIAAAVNPLVSQAYGAKKPDGIARAVALGVWAALICGILSWVVLYPIDRVFELLDYPAGMALQATEYTRAAMLGLPAAFVYFAIKNYLDGTSRPKIPFMVAIVAVVVNAFVDYALLFGHFGFPKLGVQGAGFATATVYTFMALTLIAVGWKREFTTALFRTTATGWREFLGVGLPIAGMICLEVGMFVMAALMMGRIGTAEAAAHQIVLTCASITFMIPLGISFAGATRVGQAIGAKRFAKVRLAGLSAIAVGVGCMTLSALAFLTVPSVFIDLFWNPTEGTGDSTRFYATQLLVIAGVFQLFDGLQVTSNGALRGMTDVKIPLLIGTFSYWVVGLSSAIGLGLYTDLAHRGVWLGLLAGLVCAGTSLFIRFLILSRRLRTDRAFRARVTTAAAAETA